MKFTKFELLSRRSGTRSRPLPTPMLGHPPRSASGLTRGGTVRLSARLAPTAVSSPSSRGSTDSPRAQHPERNSVTRYTRFLGL